MLLDGTLSVDELRAAILESREARSKIEIDRGIAALTRQIVKLPIYRGWEVTTGEHPSTKRDVLVWEHDRFGGTNVTVWCTLDHPRGLNIDVYDPDDPSDTEGWIDGGIVDAPTNAAGFFAACKKFLDDQIDQYEEMSEKYPAPKTAATDEDTARLVREQEELPRYRGWQFTYEYPGLFCYSHPELPYHVFFTPDWEGAESLPIEVQTADGDYVEAHSTRLPLPREGRTGQKIFDMVRPTLDKLLAEKM